jgi:hypothetical protein
MTEQAKADLLGRLAKITTNVPEARRFEAQKVQEDALYMLDSSDKVRSLTDKEYDEVLKKAGEIADGSSK